MKLSVIVLAYNSADTIRETLDSITNQINGLEQDAEIIVSDDGSKDNTKEVLLEYQNNKQINLLFNAKNIGVVKNFFNAYNHCHGEYIMVCAGDDYWLPGKVTDQLFYMDQHEETSMCCANALSYDPQNGELYQRVGFSEKIISFEKLLVLNTIFAVTACVRKEILDKYIETINPINKDWLMEDYPIWLWISKNGQIDYIDENMAVYRMGENTISRPGSQSKQLAFEESTWDVLQYYARTGTERRLAEAGHLQRLESIYLRYNDSRGYRTVIKQKKGIKSKLLYVLSFYPGFTMVVNKRRNKRHTKE